MFGNPSLATEVRVERERRRLYATADENLDWIAAVSTRDFLNALGIATWWGESMRHIRMLPVVIFLFALSALPCVAQKNSPMAASEEIVGTVQSFSGNTLAIKPPATPSVWVTIPEGMKVDRDELKPGTEVSVEARWALVCYVATKPPEAAPKKSSGG
jgi:hypothetical protein